MQPALECCVEEHGSHLPASALQSLPSPAQLLLQARDGSFLAFIPFTNWSMASEMVDLPHCEQDPALGLARLGLPCAFCEVKGMGWGHPQAGHWELCCDKPTPVSPASPALLPIGSFPPELLPN